MAYTALSDFLVSDIVSELAPDTVFAALTSAQYIPTFNTVQTQIANLYCAKALPQFKVGVYGALVTSGTQSAIGTYGYVASINMTTSTPKSIIQIQIQKSSVLSDVYNTESDLDDLFNFCEDSGCPDAAYTLVGNMLSVFLKTSVYPFDANTLVQTLLYRNVIPLTLVGSSIDVPNEARRLFALLVLLQAYRIYGRRVEAFITDGVQEEKSVLGLL